MNILKSLAIGALCAAITSPGALAAPPTKVKHPDWSRNAVIYEVNMRQYSPEGTFEAFTRQLPRLKDLGVDILWLMPIHPISKENRKGTLGSYYAVADYLDVNPEYGTKDDFRRLVDQAHALGMKVILDWVPNHSGCDNPWVTEHPDWYERDAEGKMYGPFDWTDVYAFDYSNPEMRRGMTDAFKYWLTEMGVDGFRCDVAMEVPTDFWNEVRPQLQAVKPDLFMLAEASVPELQAEAFDMGYNWPMKDLFSEIASTQGEYTFVKDGQKEPAKLPARNACHIDSLLDAQATDYPAGTIMMNMITNHDLNSWEGTEFDRLGRLQGAFAVLSYTLPGMPLIYTGQETGLNRALEFFEKDKSPEWEPRNEYFTFYRKLNDLKHSHPALQAGDGGAPMKRIETTSPETIYAFSRETPAGDRVLVVTNLSSKPGELKFKGETPAVDGLINLFTGQPAAFPASLESGAYLVFTSK